jgi:cytochrome c biogenesis protein CcdA
VKRIARKLFLVGLLAFIGACVVLYIFEHAPWPWGGGTLPGGMSDADNNDSAFDRTMRWQLGVLGVSFAVGLSGVLFLLAAGVAWLVSVFRHRTRQLPNLK